MWKWLTVTNSPAYYRAKLITAVKGYVKGTQLMTPELILEIAQLKMAML
jgi:hypothetical protein